MYFLAMLETLCSLTILQAFVLAGGFGEFEMATLSGSDYSQ
jgi:hypothetical protein